MSVAFHCMIDAIDVGDLGKNRPWIFGSWMESKSVYTHSKELRRSMISWFVGMYATVSGAISYP